MLLDIGDGVFSCADMSTFLVLICDTTAGVLKVC